MDVHNIHNSVSSHSYRTKYPLKNMMQIASGKRTCTKAINSVLPSEFYIEYPRILRIIEDLHWNRGIFGVERTSLHHGGLKRISKSCTRALSGFACIWFQELRDVPSNAILFDGPPKEVLFIHSWQSPNSKRRCQFRWTHCRICSALSQTGTPFFHAAVALHVHIPIFLRVCRAGKGGWGFTALGAYVYWLAWECTCEDCINAWGAMSCICWELVRKKWLTWIIFYTYMRRRVPRRRWRAHGCKALVFAKIG